MIRRLAIITFMALILFAVELLLFNIFGHWFKPNLLIILIVFVNLYLGVRYSIAAAVIAGVIHDCFSVNFFGISILSFIICAYMTTMIRRYYYEVGSQSSRVTAVFLVSIINVFLHYIINVMFTNVNFSHMLTHIMVPEVLMTLLATSYTFKTLKKYSLRIAL